MRAPARSAALALLAALLSDRAAGHAAEAPPVFHGTWIATAGSAPPFHGSWSAQALPGQPDDVQGSWSVVDESGGVVAQGTWAARRSKRGFDGKWSARAVSGVVYSGSFEAHVPGFKGKTLEALFAETSTRQISGFWRLRGGAHGAWYLKGSGDAPAP